MVVGHRVEDGYQEYPFHRSHDLSSMVKWAWLCAFLVFLLCPYNMIFQCPLFNFLSQKYKPPSLSLPLSLSPKILLI